MAAFKRFTVLNKMRFSGWLGQVQELNEDEVENREYGPRRRSCGFELGLLAVANLRRLAGIPAM